MATCTVRLDVQESMRQYRMNLGTSGHQNLTRVENHLPTNCLLKPRIARLVEVGWVYSLEV